MGDEETAMKSKIQLELKPNGCGAEMRINDIPIRITPRENPKEFSVSVQHYLVDGENTIKLIVNPGPTPSTVLSEKVTLDETGIDCLLRAVDYPIGVYPGDPAGNNLAQVRFLGQKDIESEFPKSLTAAFNIKTGNNWSWQAAESIKLNEKNESEIIDFLKDLRAAFVQRDANVIWPLIQIRVNDAIAAMPGINVAHQKTQFFDTFEEYKAYSDWSIPEVNEDKLDLRVVANGKMVECRYSDWSNVITTGPLEAMYGDVFDYPLLISKMDGKWQIVR